MRSALLAALAIASGCVEQGPGPLDRKKVDPTYVQAHLLAAPPPAQDLQVFDVAVGDVAIYLGNKVDKPRVAPGQAVTITHYWKVLKTPGPAWNVFTLVRGPAGTADFMNVLPSDMQIAHGPATWETGEIIEDIHTFTVRPDWRSAEATVLVGLIEQGKHGTLDRMAVKGPKTRDQAIVARVLEVDLSRAPAPKGTVYIPRAQGAITVDGVLSDPGWAGAVQGELVTAEGGSDPLGKAVAKMVWDDEFLYVQVAITDSDVVSPFKQQDDPLWKGDCVELFIDADGNRKGYVELQANPIGITFDSWFAQTRASPGDEGWDSNMVAAAKLRGGTEAGDSGDTGWDVELAIPWAAVKGRDDRMAVKLPPQVGDRWRLNVVRVDRKSGAKPNELAASSWNRITMADFHALDRMLVAVFADASGSIVPQAQSSTPASIEAPSVDVRLVEQIDPKTPALVVDLGAGVRIAGKAIPDASLDAALASAAQRDKGIELVLRVEAGVPYPRALALIDRAKAAGFTRIAFVAEAAGSGSGSGSGSAGSGSGSGSGSAAVIVGMVGSAAKPVGSGAALAGAALPFGVVLDLAKPIDVEVAVAGARVGGKLLGDEQVAIAMRAVLAKSPGARVVLRTDGSVPHARIVAVIKQLEPLRGQLRIALAVTAGVAVPLPSSVEVPVAPQNSLIIEIPVAGDVVVAGKPFKDAQLDDLFAATFARDKSTQVVVRAAIGVPNARVVGIGERLKRAGLTRIVSATPNK
jgi:biopolymer transport protein ExbD